MRTSRIPRTTHQSAAISRRPGWGATAARGTVALLALALMSGCGNAAAGQSAAVTSAELAAKPTASSTGTGGKVCQEARSPSRVALADDKPDGRTDAEKTITPPSFDSPVWNGLSLADRQMFTQMSQIRKVFSQHAANIWSPKFRPDQSAVMAADASTEPGKIDPKYAYVFGDRRPSGLGKHPKRVRLPKELGLPPVYRIDQGPLLEKIRRERIVFGEDRGTYIGIYSPHSRDDSPVIGADTSLMSLIYVHEWFHGFEGSRHFESIPSESSGSPDVSTYPRQPADVHALALVEDCVLSQPAATPEQAREVLRTFLAIRTKRWETQPELLDKEATGDQMEGMARFTEDLFAKHARYKLVIKSDWQRSTQPKPLFIDLAAGRGYSVGSAVGRLLEQATGSSRWRRLVADGLTPHQAAARLLGQPTGAERDRLIEQAKTTYDYPAQLKVIQEANFPDLDFGSAGPS